MSVGMPETIYLEQFASLLRTVFKHVPYHVGSSLDKKTGWRDVDVRILFDDEEWIRWDFGDPKNPNLRWTAYCAAFSELGRRMTGLPIDFQIQQNTFAQTTYSRQEYGVSALGIIWRDDK